MGVVSGDSYKPEIWKEYKEIIEKHDARAATFEFIERFDFYERTKKAYAVIATGEGARYANIILKKGIIGD
jgi:L-fucose mutarotase